MKPKGIKFIELIADKLLLALFALAFLAVVALQFVGGGTSVSVGNQSDVPIDRAYNEVITLAERKRAAMTSDDVAPEAPKNAPEVAERLELAMITPDDGGRITQLVEAKPLPGSSVGRDREGESQRFALPEPPAPSQPVAEAFGGALDPYELKAAPALGASLLNGPDQQPYDLFAISVQSQFDAAAYRRLLEADPDGPGPLAPLPRNWWNNRVEVLDVRLYRREVYDDGATGAEELLPPPPGFASLRDRLSDDLPVGDLNQLVRIADQAERARQIRAPFFYRMIAGEPWSPPMHAGDPNDLSWANPPQRMREADTVSIWAHDVTAEPGATYQYRIQLVFPNPLKGYEASIDEDLRHLADPATIESVPTAWSAPVQTPRAAYNFVQRAAIPQQGAVGIARPFAIVELYRFYYGYWRRGEMRVQAGDLIASEIQLPGALPLWSVDGQTAQRIGDVAGSISADTGAFLLDVVAEPSPEVAGPGRAQTRNAAIIGTGAGEVAVRRPDVDARSPLRTRLSESAAEANNATVASPLAGARAVIPAAGPAGPQGEGAPDGRGGGGERLGG